MHPQNLFGSDAVNLDDITVREKTVPGTIEAVTTTHPLVQDAIVFGSGNCHMGALVELRAPPEAKDLKDPTKLASLRNQIWPTIEEANVQGPTCSRISKEMILFSSKDKPLPRAIDGTILRSAALEMYDREISTSYENVKMGSIITEVRPPVSWDVAQVEIWIMNQVSEITSRTYVSPDVDLFHQGFDSFSAAILRLRIVNAMRLSEKPSLELRSQAIEPDLIYKLLTVRGIANYVAGSLQTEIQQSERLRAIEELIIKYDIRFVPSFLENAAPPPLQSFGLVVLLTGSTGQLGAQIMTRLLEDNRIRRVYAFNRPGTDLRTRHKARFDDIGLDPRLLESGKLVLISGNSAQHYLGLDKQLYDEISSSIDVLIHNAWNVDFHVPLSSFESAIQSSRNLMDLVMQSPNASHVRFIFISTVASLQSWDDSRGPVPEDTPEDASYSLGGGYGEAKYVVERLLTNSGLQGTSIRFGQICGGLPKGSWPTTDWLPMLVKSSVMLGIIPDLDGKAAWLPGDLAASVVVNVALAAFELPIPRVFNVIHPLPVDHKMIISDIVSGIKEVMGRELQIVPVEDWILMFDEYAKRTTAENLVTTPVKKVIAFLRRYATWKSSPRTFALNNSRSLGLRMGLDNIESINSNDVKRWVEYWYGRGYLPLSQKGQ